MRKLVSIYRSNKNEEARIYVSSASFICEVKDMSSNEVVAKLVVSGDSNCAETDLLPIDFGTYYKVPFERKNGKIVLYPINKKRRIIFTNNDYDEWCEAMADEITDEEITPEYYGFCCETNLSDERCNLDVEVDGYIVMFANLGLWNGRHDGGKLIGHNVKDILYSDCDYVTWYCDEYNVRCDAIHHDGTNHYLYRVVDSKEKINKILDGFRNGTMTEEKFRRLTKSLRPYVAKVYGW
jgi:hypothetical protein